MESREVAVVEVWLSVVSARLTRPLVRPDNSLWKYIHKSMVTALLKVKGLLL